MHVERRNYPLTPGMQKFVVHASSKLPKTVRRHKCLKHKSIKFW